MALQKFVVLIVALMMIAGLSMYVALDSDLFVHDTEVINTENVSNTVNNK